MGWFKREWSNVLTVGCIVVAAIVEAWQQALAGSPKVAEVLPSLSNSWHYVPLGLLIIAGMSWLIGHSGRASHSGQQQGTALQAALGISMQPPVDFNAAQFFRLAYHSDWTADVEKRIRIAAHQNQPNVCEDFYAKFIGVGMVAYYHDIVWAYIFKSQITMLMELNRRGGLMPLADMIQRCTTITQRLNTPRCMHIIHSTSGWHSATPSSYLFAIRAICWRSRFEAKTF
jgi:hypothetical protein